MVRPKAQTAALLASPEDIEAQFYEAMQQGDIDKLMAVWSDEDDTVCVHPGGPRVVGPRAIRAAFAAIFTNGPISVRPEKVKRMLSTTSAVHNVLECVSVSTDEGVKTAWVIATNVYLKTAQGWRLVVHHASPGTAVEPPDVGDAPSILH
jgi:ketosteroid isomerase-like protein